MAEIMGYPNWAAYNLLPKMAETPAAVFSFLDNLHNICEKKTKEEIARISTLKKETCGDEKINSWDYSFFQSMQLSFLELHLSCG